MTTSLIAAFALTSHGGDPQLKPGFPVQLNLINATSVTRYLTVGNVDADPDLEIVYAVRRTSLLDDIVVVNPNGQVGTSPVNRALDPRFLLSLGDIAKEMPGNEIMLSYAMPGTTTAEIGVFNQGRFVRGFPLRQTNHIGTPAMFDFNGDGLDDMIFGGEDGRIWKRLANGGAESGPLQWAGAHPSFPTICVADITGDGKRDIIACNSPTATSQLLVGVGASEGYLTGWPVSLPPSMLINSCVAGDVDGDGQIEAVVLQRASGVASALIINNAGQIERTIALSGTFSSTSQATPSLADLDGDGFPEILVQTDSAVNVVKGNGTSLTGWPVALPTWTTRSSPVVGDLNGDTLPDICVFATSGETEDGQLIAYHSTGQVIPGFPKTLPLRQAGCAAIADIDRDGRNELIVARSSSELSSGLMDAVWAYDLQGANYGPVLWSQYGGSARHLFSYPVIP